MEDRIIDLPGKAEAKIRQEALAYFIDGENHDYFTNDAILVHQKEANHLSQAAETIFNLYEKALQYVVHNNQWDRLDIPEEIIPLIELDFDRGVPHICGRMDFAGGIEGLPLKLIEFNADTPAVMPESAFIQKWMLEPVIHQYKGQLNYLVDDLTQVFRDMKAKFPKLLPTLLMTSLGHEEDILNLAIIEDAAKAAGFATDYADLEEVIFADDGVYLDNERGYTRYNFIYKMVPWEIIMFEEPELLDILVNLSINHGLVVLNPAYSIALQSKHMLSVLYELFPDHPYLLPTYDKVDKLQGKKYVSKVNFGRQGENIQIISAKGKKVAETKGDFGHYSRVYQEFAEMYADEDGDIYQASMYTARGNASCLSFRRRDAMIIDDDSEFVAHVLFE